MKSITGVTIAGAAALLLASAAYAGEREVEGAIVSGGNGAIVLRTATGDQTIRVNGDTKVRQKSGLFNKTDMPPSSLITGLHVEAEIDDETGFAKEVDFTDDDYKMALSISAGGHATAMQAEANRQRAAELQQHTQALQASNTQLRELSSNVGEWDLREESNIYFKTGSSAISAAEKQKLVQLAGKAKGIKGYMISVTGHADPRGGAAENTRLSGARALSVMNYLKQNGGLQPNRVVSGSAMGELASADEPAEHAEARRVTVRILTSKAQLRE
ncbi:MAG: OmpA family protein [Allosphingosinicella sp.]